jgi:hypothetical protein
MTKQDVWNEKQDSFDARTYIETRVRLLFAVFNRRASDELVEVFKNRLEQFSKEVLRKVFDQCESELEKFPTVKHVLMRCYEQRPSGAWRYNYVPTVDHEGIPCLRDPDPACSDCNKLRSEHPHKQCSGWVSRNNNKFLYLPQNCPEGREFLKLLREMAVVKSIPFVDEEVSRRNLQAQAIAITKHKGYQREPGED